MRVASGDHSRTGGAAPPVNGVVLRAAGIVTALAALTVSCQSDEEVGPPSG